MAILTTGDKSVVKQKIELNNKPILIGRHPECDVIIDDGSVSRHHAQITNEHGAFYIEDLKSRNGTYVNDSQVNGPAKLFDGHVIKICDVAFVFHLSDHGSVYPGSRPTMESVSEGADSIIIDDDVPGHEASNVMSELDAVSHYDTSAGKVDAAAKLQALIQITHALSDAVLLQDILDRSLECLFDLFKEADRGFIVLKMPDGKIVPKAMNARRPQDDEKIRISLTLIRKVMDSKRPLLSTDAATDSRFDMSQSIADFRIRSVMCAPLINNKNESIGVIQLDTLKKSIAFCEEDLELLVTVGMHASLAIQKAELYQEARKTVEIQADLKLAHELQLRFLPQRNPDIEDYQFFAFYKPMQQVGGDYYDFVPLDESRTAIIVADVVGHGITAAMMMAKVSAESRFALATSSDPVEAIRKMNESLADMNVDRFVTLVLGVLDHQTNNMKIVNAGHMPPILRRGESNEITLVDGNESGLPLGVMPDAEFQSIEIQLDAGDTIVMYTDGINESMNENDEQLTVTRLVEEIKISQTKTPDAIGALICQVVDRHVGTQATIDDMCLVCVGRDES